MISMHCVDDRLIRLAAKHSSSTPPCVPDGQMLRYKYKQRSVLKSESQHAGRGIRMLGCYC